MLTNVTELYGKLDTGSIKHNFNLGVEFSRETNKNASYGVKNGTGSTTCPAIFAAGSLDCTPYLTPKPSDPWSGSITRQPLHRDSTSNTRPAYLFDHIALPKQSMNHTR